MNPIQIRILQGPAAGRSRTFAQPRLTFGRAADNDIVVDVAYASREHGELRWDEAGHWTVVNHSPNGTTINRRKLGRKPPVLRSGDVVGVAGQPLFEVTIEASATHGAAASEPAESTAAAAGAEAAEPEKPRLAGRTRLWVFLGGYLAVMAVVFVVLIGLFGDGEDRAAAPAPQLTDSQIAASITRPLDRRVDERAAARALRDARRLYQQSRANPDLLYEAYREFKQAAAYSNGQAFEDQGMAYREFRQCERELIDHVTSLYRRGYAQLREQQYRLADDTFQRLLEIFPDSQSQLYDNVEHQRSVARARATGGRR